MHATTQIHQAVEDFDRTRSPFGGVVDLEATGPHTFWIEGDCLSCVGNGAQEYRDAATVSVTGPAGNSITLRPAGDRLYNTGGNEGRALWTFDVDTPGAHRITLGFDTTGAWDNRLPGRIAVGPGRGLPARVVVPMAWMACGAAVAAGAWAAAWRARRERWFRARLAAGERASAAPRPTSG